jgi:hypothetical protein
MLLGFSPRRIIKNAVNDLAGPERKITQPDGSSDGGSSMSGRDTVIFTSIPMESRGGD